MEPVSMTRLNYNHLHYFWVVATTGSIAGAAQILHVTPQTISGQIRSLEDRFGGPLFRKSGRRLALTDAGRIVLSYAEPMFRHGEDLLDLVKSGVPRRSSRLRVGVAMVVPKLIAYRLLAPALAVAEPAQIICHEAPLQSLLADIAVHRLDLVLTDSPMSPTYNVRAYNHLLGECGLSFFAAGRKATGYRRDFPDSLHGAPVLLPSESSALRASMTHWFQRHGISVRMVAEFEDTALMNAFGEAGAGIFALPTVIEKEVQRKYRVRVIGRTSEIKERFYAISIERKLRHPAIVAITNAARTQLFG
jgi:LysR family transcriptional activator of nhaA